MDWIHVAQDSIQQRDLLCSGQVAR